MRRDYDIRDQFPAPADARFASLEDAFVAGLKPLVRLWTRDEQSREVLRLNEEPVQDKDKVA